MMMYGVYDDTYVACAKSSAKDSLKIDVYFYEYGITNAKSDKIERAVKDYMAEMMPFIEQQLGEGWINKMEFAIRLCMGEEFEE